MEYVETKKKRDNEAATQDSLEHGTDSRSNWNQTQFIREGDLRGNGTCTSSSEFSWSFCRNLLLLATGAVWRVLLHSVSSEQHWRNAVISFQFHEVHYVI
jgi:hypothetical protein